MMVFKKNVMIVTIFSCLIVFLIFFGVSLIEAKERQTEEISGELLK
ncbi:hypothetical protein IMZ08_16155 [Bacillus luteolus]|uniref:Uncharacterized protein n=1 Tax=Litchfieldia luteola TaxID=682179 RepID=A0ABR9QMF4_9BACI|nr:hypothetical protein [Cytobacillus luteolus]MBE4909586.1 hypothetical protein [Cytobacillus luteolus]MBP1940987.1 hypothetical protein [Cytobacillus luteolus]